MNRALVVVSFIAFSTSLFMRAVDPVVPQISGEFGIPAADVALLATAFALPFAVIQPLLGPVGDFFGKTKLIIVGMMVLVAAVLPPNGWRPLDRLFGNPSGRATAAAAAPHNRNRPESL